jgi:excinuclease UvrABC nuclease subunit
MTEKRFTPSKTITKANIEKVPGDKPGVYRIQNAQGKTLYIGMAKGGRLNDRIAEHKGEFKGGTRFQYKLAPNKETAERIERKEIKNWKPVFNKKDK